MPRPKTTGANASADRKTRSDRRKTTVDTDSLHPDQQATRQYSDVEVGIGEGGETHQVADDTHDALTTAHGVRVADNQNSLGCGRARSAAT